MKHRLITFIVAILAPVMAFGQPYLDKSLSPEERAADLVGRLTLDEKVVMMRNASEGVERLGIKAYNWWNEALHGVARNGSATVFPQPIGMAASFDEPLLLEVFKTVSDEARVKNRIAASEGEVGIYQGLTFWTPNINIFRDPRWGRGMETYGEDPYLMGRLGMAVVRGLQDDEGMAVEKAHACAKHFAVHSGPESLRHSFDAVVSERDLRETYLPAFKDLVTKAGVREVMTAYNAFRGEPCALSDYLVNTVLRGEWGYKGLVVTDCHAIHDLYLANCHNRFPDDPVASSAAALKNGVDVECGGHFQRLNEAVARGLVTEEDIDKALTILLKERFALGEMDGESPWDSLPDSIVEGPDHRALALTMARESMVLLQNRNGVLPLSKDGKVALLGPNADNVEMMWGNYNPVPKETITLLSALRSRIPDLVYEPACGIADSLLAPGRTIPVLPLEQLLEKLEGIETVIFAGGISPRFEGEEMRVDVEGFEGGDRSSIELPKVQRLLLQALHEAGKKVVLVNFSGSAMGLVPETESCDAILQAWYPGQDGGTAVADVLFGDVNPSGKLPLTFYKSVDDLPPFEDYAMKGRTYRYFTGEPLFAFGYGLGYSPVVVKKARVRGSKVIVKLVNRGKMDADEVVQLYVRRPSDTEGPLKTLRGFVRVKVKAGKRARISLPLDDDTFLWWDENAGDMVTLAGDYELMVGTSSRDEDLKVLKYKKI